VGAAQEGEDAAAVTERLRQLLMGIDGQTMVLSGGRIPRDSATPVQWCAHTPARPLARPPARPLAWAGAAGAAEEARFGPRTSQAGEVVAAGVPGTDAAPAAEPLGAAVWAAIVVAAATGLGLLVGAHALVRPRCVPLGTSSAGQAA
jgi:hypothetical protein